MSSGKRRANPRKISSKDLLHPLVASFNQVPGLALMLLLSLRQRQTLPPHQHLILYQLPTLPPHQRLILRLRLTLLPHQRLILHLQMMVTLQTAALQMAALLMAVHPTVAHQTLEAIAPLVLETSCISSQRLTSRSMLQATGDLTPLIWLLELVSMFHHKSVLMVPALAALAQAVLAPTAIAQVVLAPMAHAQGAIALLTPLAIAPPQLLRLIILRLYLSMRQLLKQPKMVASLW